jgi:hypothetical protein
MKLKIEKNDNPDWELIKKDIEASVRLSRQDHHYLRIDINSVGSDSKELPIEERRRLLWEVLKDNYHDDEVEVTSPNGDKTYLKKYGDTPFLGVVNFFYSCGETNVGVFIYIGPKFSLLHIFSEDKGVNYEEIRELLDDSLNKAMAKHSLSVSLSGEVSEEDFDAFLDFLLRPWMQNHFQ